MSGHSDHCVRATILPAPQGEMRPFPAWCRSSVWALLKGNSRLDWSSTGGRTEKPAGRFDTLEHLGGTGGLHSVTSAKSEKYSNTVTDDVFSHTNVKQLSYNSYIYSLLLTGHWKLSENQYETCAPKYNVYNVYLFTLIYKYSHHHGPSVLYKLKCAVKKIYPNKEKIHSEEMEQNLNLTILNSTK